MPTYFITPGGTPSHTAVLTAMVVTGGGSSTLPAGLGVEWRQDGSVVKSGTSDDPAMLQINTGIFGDVNFDATDTGATVDFVVDGIDYSNSVILSNTLPTVTAQIDEDAYGRTSRQPIVSWTFTDPEGDEQYYFKAIIDAYNSGNVFGDTPGDIDDDGDVDRADYDATRALDGVISTDPTYNEFADADRDGTITAVDAILVSALFGSSYSVMNSYSYKFKSPTILAAGTSFSWSLTATDGEKVNPLDPDSFSTLRTTVSSSGSGVANTPPVVSAVQIDGNSSPASIESYAPVISWTYSDVDGQPQQYFQLKVAKDQFQQNVVWASPRVPGVATQATYNFDGSGQVLDPHTTYYAFVTVWDTFESSTTSANFSISNPPVIRVVTVNGQVNPMNLRVIDGDPITFRWEAQDADTLVKDPLVSFEFRLSDSIINLGTDLFVGTYASVSQITPEAFQAVVTNSFGYPPSPLQPATTYYFQVRVSTATETSTWWFGFLRLNAKPTATDVEIVPNVPYGSDDLTASYVFVDDPGEQESDKTKIRWYKNGVEQSSLRDLRVVSHTLTTPGDEWLFTVQPHDGVEFSAIPVTSLLVVILNRPPVATAIGVSPAEPTTLDALTANFNASDPDGDPVTVRISWFKQEGNEASEVTELRNSPVVPPGFTSKGQSWWFTAIPHDGYVSGQPATSNPVMIVNSKPTIGSITVDGKNGPKSLSNSNPIIAWAYQDPDGDAQQAYHVLIGNKPLRTRASRAGLLSTAACGDEKNGVIAISFDGEVLAGDEVFDTGVVSSTDSFVEYATADNVKPKVLTPVDAAALDNYTIGNSASFLQLKTGKARGSVVFTAVSLAKGLYLPELTYPKSSTLTSMYSIFLNGALVDGKKSSRGTGNGTIAFRPINVSSGDVIKIQGDSVDPGAVAPFSKVTLRPLSSFEIEGQDFQHLSGYTPMDEHGIRLVGLAGTASTPFEFPSGKYDIDISYLTEALGQPVLSISVNGSAIDSFMFETGIATRKRVVQNIQLSAGDIIKLSGTRNLNASARVLSVAFRPKEVSVAGAKLQDGLTYYASIRTFDGDVWSDWYTTRFSMGGSAWESTVSNSTGWTIETRFSLVVQDK